MSDSAARRPADPRVRLFVALELPAAVRGTLVRWREGVLRARPDALRPLAAESLHVTLCFLGWRSEDEVDAIAAACRVLAAEPAAPLAVGRGMWLPARRPRVLAVELHDREARLGRAQAALSAALSAGGWYEPEQRPYLAHVTVARVGAGLGPRRAGGGSGPPELPDPPRREFIGSEVVLYRSRLSRSGARYEPLARVELMQTGSNRASTA